MNAPAATLENFQSTRRRVEDLSTDANVCGGCSDLPGYVYVDRFFIEIEPDGSLYLPLVQQEHRAPASDLERLEVLLFEYAQHEGLDADQCHTARVAADIACPPCCPVCGGAS